MGMSKYKQIGEIVYPAPKINLKKGELLNYIPMEELMPNNRFVKATQKREFKGGAKFEHNDVVFARITPCLQNRKIAQYINESMEPAYGSTEYFIFRAIPEISDSAYIYYLLKSDLVVETAINSMKGASGRQRAEIDAVLDLEIDVPEYDTQIKIGNVLSVYDNLIENNNRRIAILEEMAQRLYREWFVHFRFPGHGNVKMVESELGLIPEGWEPVRLETIIRRDKPGKLYDNKTVEISGKVPVFDQGKSGIIGYHNDEPGINASITNPVIIFANHTCYQRLVLEPFSAIQNVIPFYPEEAERDIYWLHYATKDLIEINDYKGHWPEFMNKVLLLPALEVCKIFGKSVKDIESELFLISKKNKILRKTRDHLLPQLISGDIDVSDLPIKMKEDSSNE